MWGLLNCPLSMAIGPTTRRAIASLCIPGVFAGLQGQAGNVTFPLEDCGELLWLQDLWSLALRLTSFIVLFNFLTKKAGGDKGDGCFSL